MSSVNLALVSCSQLVLLFVLLEVLDKSRAYSAAFQQHDCSFRILSQKPASIPLSTRLALGAEVDDRWDPSNEPKEHRWNRSLCVKGVAPRSGPLNEAIVSILRSDSRSVSASDSRYVSASGSRSVSASGSRSVSASDSRSVSASGSQYSDGVMISLDDANKLIEIGAVWAKMEGLTEEELLGMYEGNTKGAGGNTDIGGSSRALYADLAPKRQRDSVQPKRTRMAKDAAIVELKHRDDEVVSEEDFEVVSEVDSEVDLDDYVEEMKNQRYRRILAPSWIEAGTDIRIYPEPRRFPSACAEFSNPSRLLYEDTTFIVVDKPPMLPTQPDASNYIECCQGCVDQYLGPFYDINDELVTNRPFLCHRVDSCVGGCVVLSKNRNGQKVFQKFQRERALRKMYLAVTQNPVPTGIHIHWMWSPQTTRGSRGGPPCQLISLKPPDSKRKAREFWKRCVLEVTECVTIPVDHLGQDLDQQRQYYQSTIRLVTGRKHQVRAQLAALGCPILRDTLYEPIAGLTLDLLEKSPVMEAKMDEAVLQCAVPFQPIGLQAAGILFGGIRVKANPPWWARKSSPTNSRKSR